MLTPAQTAHQTGQDKLLGGELTPSIAEAAAAAGETGSEGGFDASRATRPLLGIIIATVVFFFAHFILSSLAAAIILAIIVSPIVDRLERYIGRVLASVVVVLVLLAVIGTAIYFLTVRLTQVAAEVAGHSDNIAAKLKGIEQHAPGWLQQVESGITNVKEQLQNKQPRKRTATVVESKGFSVSDFLQPIIPVLSGVAQALLIIVLLLFMLVASSDLRERFVRLAARAKITVAAEAIQSAIGTVGHYLLFYSISNFSFGCIVALVLWIIGMENPIFWGGFAFIARFVPYVGAILSGALPVLVAFAIFPGWTRAIEIGAAYIVLDQLLAEFLEPYLIGTGLGLAPIAMLICAIYWAWVWGALGLLLATPITACLKIAGDYIPPLNFFSLLFGAHTDHEEHQTYYARMLELNTEGARKIVISYSIAHGFDRAIAELLLPTLETAYAEHAQNHISQEILTYVEASIRETGEELGNRLIKRAPKIRARILGVCPTDESRMVELLLLLELLRADGVSAGYAGEHAAVALVEEFARRFGPDQIVLFCSTPDLASAAVELARRLHAALPSVAIVATGAGVQPAKQQLLDAGCARVCSGFLDTCRLMLTLNARRT